MNRRKKLIILILIVCIIGIFAFVGSLFLGGPSLASGDKNILVPWLVTKMNSLVAV